MCGPNLFAFLIAVYVELLVLSSVASRIDAGWVWLWCVLTAITGWRLLRRNFSDASSLQSGGIQLSDARVVIPLGLMMPGFITDLTAMVLICRRSYRRHTVASRPRKSALWVGEPDAQGNIPVQAVRVDKEIKPED
ncbi:MAG: FxsA family protein [Bradymonadia bacterium]